MEDIFEELAEEDLREEAVDDPDRNEDRAEGEDEEGKTVVQPKVKRTVKPRPKLDAARLTGPRGIVAIAQTFENIKLKGKHHELDDLTLVLTRLQHWAHRLYPKLNFEDCIARIEELGSKKPVARAMGSLRSGDLVADQTETVERSPSPRLDPFDLLLPPEPPKTTLTEEQKARMLKNRLLAEERRMAKIKAAQNEANNVPSDNVEAENLFNEDHVMFEAFNPAESQISSNQNNSDHHAECTKDTNDSFHKTIDATVVQNDFKQHENPDEVSTLIVENDTISNETTIELSDTKILAEEENNAISPECETNSKSNEVIKNNEAELKNQKSPDDISTLLVDNINNETTMDVDQSIIDAFDEDM